MQTELDTTRPKLAAPWTKNDIPVPDLPARASDGPAALHGLISRIRDMDMTLISVNRITDDSLEDTLGVTKI